MQIQLNMAQNLICKYNWGQVVYEWDAIDLKNINFFNGRDKTSKHTDLVMGPNLKLI